MPHFGAHMSIAGGYYKALELAEKFECTTVQLFTKNNNQWKAKELLADDIALFRETAARLNLQHMTAHDSYLINLASPDDELYRKSIEAFVIEMERAEALGLANLVMHPGAHMGTGESEGIARVANAFNEILQRCPEFQVKILLETTAGQGTALGYRFEHLAEILQQVDQPDRFGVCVDTCHIFAAGYPLHPKRMYSKTFREFDEIVGLEKIRCFHVNDSKKTLGSRVDRHEHLGRGHIGLEPFGFLVNDRRFRNLPMILETPKSDGPNKEMDAVNLATLRKLLK